MNIGSRNRTRWPAWFPESKIQNLKSKMEGACTTWRTWTAVPRADVSLSAQARCSLCRRDRRAPVQSAPTIGPPLVSLAATCRFSTLARRIEIESGSTPDHALVPLSLYCDACPSRYGAQPLRTPQVAPSKCMASSALLPYLVPRNRVGRTGRHSTGGSRSALIAESALKSIRIILLAGLDGNTECTCLSGRHRAG